MRSSKNTPKAAGTKKFALNCKLYDQAFDGDVAGVIDSLSAGADPDFNGSTADAATPLIAAANRGYIQVVQLLLGKKAAINKTNAEGCTALWVAIKHGHHDIAKLLLQRGADHSQKVPGSHYTPLHLAATLNNLAIMQLLLDKGADVNAASELGETALHFAAEHGHADGIKLLLKCGANTEANEEDERGATPLLRALEKEHDHCVKALLEGGAKTDNLYSDDATTALHAAAMFNRIESAKLILKKDDRVNCKLSDTHATPLHIAARLNHADFADLLLYCGADTSATLFDKSTTPFMCAILMGNIETAGIFLKHGIDVNSTQASDGSTALQVAIANNDKNTVAWLLKQGADISINNTDPGVNSLYTAVAADHDEILTLLLQKIIADQTEIPILSDFMEILASQHTNFDMINFIRTLQDHLIPNQTIMKLLPQRLTTDEALKVKSPLTKVIRQVKRSPPHTRQRYSLFAGHQPADHLPNLSADSAESLRQKLLSLAFNPKTVIGANLQMLGDKQSYGFIDITLDENKTQNNDLKM